MSMRVSVTKMIQKKKKKYDLYEQKKNRRNAKI